MTFSDRYGPWAVVAGASEGIGAAFAHALAARGMSLVLVARRPEALAALASSLSVPTLTVAADLASGLPSIFEATASLEVGLVVANAAYAPSGPFVGLSPDDAHRVVAVNCDALVRLANHYLPPMVERRRGGLIVMSSAAGLQGGPLLSVYAASKSFGATLAEGLWWEMRPHGVDVLTCVAGAVSTPGLARASQRPAPGTVTPSAVAAAALTGLGKGPRVVPGAFMRMSTVLMGRLMPRRLAIGVMAKATSKVLTPPDATTPEK
jgi:short-subunit dehydrogenase